MVKDSEYSIERIADRAQIQDVLLKWCRSVDRLDYEGMRKTFHPDAKDTHGPYVGGVDGLIEWIRERHKTIPFSTHLLTNILIEFAGTDFALVESQAVTVLTQPAGDPTAVPLDVVIFARNVDRFERRGGEWRIKERVVVFDSRTAIAQPELAIKWGAGFVLGRRDGADAIFQARKSLGLS